MAARSPCQIQDRVPGLMQHGGTSGELSVGDLVAVGEVPLAVARLGWAIVRGGLNEARTDEPGTRPLPAVGPASAAGPTQQKESSIYEPEHRRSRAARA